MDTQFVNSQLVTRKSVRVWFFLERDYTGEATLVADNGIVFLVKVELPKSADPVTGIAELRAALRGKTVDAELSSPRTKGQVRLRLEKADLVSSKKNALSVVATYVNPPDPKFLKLLLEPVLTRVPKKP